MDARDEIKIQILKRALIHVPFDGWSQNLLERAAVEIGVDPSYGWRLFPKGPLEAVVYWSELLDQEMLAALPSSEGLRVREKVALGVKTRLSLLAPNREAARKTAKYLAFPPHLSQSSRLLYQTVNEIWYYAGDTSTDINFYTKRGLLGWVYSSTFLYWLRDRSDNYKATWDFLDHRINEVLNLPKVPQKIVQSLFFWRRHG
ncbi:MAG TPA: COQ9 family protein [Alphaproteobacteria bacterium]|nr:COQ9 family protein [Alphaproteobacteria bacterium]